MSSSFNLGDAVLSVTLQVKDFTAALSQLETVSKQQFTKIETSANQSATEIGKAFREGLNSSNEQLVTLAERAGQAFGAITSPIGIVTTALIAFTAATKASVEQAANFEEKMSGISAVTGATGAEFKKLEKLALDMGKQTSFSATEAANGIEELAKAGVTTADIVGGGLQGALSLAASTGMKDLGKAAEISANVLNTFSLKGMDLAHVADVISNGANKSALDISGFAESLSAAGSVVASSKIGLEQFTGVISIMANSALKGSDAGTSFKSFLSALQGPSSTAASLMKKLGLEIFDSNGKMLEFSSSVKGVPTIMGNLSKAFEGLTEKQYKQSAQTIFGSDGIRAFNILMKQGPEGLNKMTAAMGEQGSAAAASAKQLDNLKGAVSGMQGAAETLAINFGSMLLPTLTLVVNEITKFINTVNNVTEIVRGVTESIRNWIKPYTEIISKNELLTSILDGLKITIGILAGAGGIVILQTAFSALAATISTIVVPVISGLVATFSAILAPVAAVAAAIGLLYIGWKNNFLGLHDITDRGVEGIKVLLARLPIYFKAVQETLGILGNVFGNIFGGIGKILAGAGELFYIYLLRPVAFVVNQIGGFLATGAKMFMGFVQSIADFFKPLINFFKSIGVAVGDFVTQAASGALQGLVGLAKGAGNAAAKALGDGVKGNNEAQKAFDKMSAGFQQVANSANGAGAQISKSWVNATTEANKVTIATLNAADAVKQTEAALANMNKQVLTSGTRFSDLSNSATKVTQEMVSALIPAAKILVNALKIAEKSGNVEAIQKAITAINEFKKANLGGAEAISIVEKSLNASTAALNKNTAAQKAAQKEADKAAKEKERIDALREALAKLNAEWKKDIENKAITERSDDAYNKRLLELQKIILKLPLQIQALFKAELNRAEAFKISSAQLVVQVNAQIAYQQSLEKLTKAVQDYSLAELEAAKTRVIAAGGDTKKLAIIQAQIDKLKQAKNEAIAAINDSNAVIAKQDTQSLIEEYDRKKAAAQGNLEELIAIELQYGQKIATLKESQRKAEAKSEIDDINKKYNQLVALNKNNADEIIRLNKQRALEISKVEQKLNLDLRQIENDRASNYTSLVDQRNDAIKSANATTQKQMRETSIQLLSDVVDRLEQEKNAVLENEDLTLQEKLKLEEDYAKQLLAAKKQQLEEQRQLEILSENERFNAQLESDRALGILTTDREALLREQNAKNLALTDKKYRDQAADYTISLEKKINAIKNQIAKSGNSSSVTQSQISASAESANNQILTSELEASKQRLKILEDEYSYKKKLADGNLEELYKLEIQYGQKISDAKAEQRKLENQREIDDINKKYDELVAKNLSNTKLVEQLNNQRNSDIKRANQSLSVDLAKYEQDRTDNYISALTDREKALANQTNETQTKLRQSSVKLFQEQIQTLETEKSSILSNDLLTFEERLAIEKQYGNKLLNLKLNLLQQQQELEKISENERYTQAIAAAKALGVYTSEIEQNLLLEHQNNLSSIETSYNTQRSQALQIYNKSIADATTALNKNLEQQAQEKAAREDKARKEAEQVTANALSAKKQINESEIQILNQETQNIVSEYERRRSIVEGNLDEELKLIQEYGPKIVEAKAKQAKAIAEREILNVISRYDALIAENKSNLELVKQLEAEKAKEIASIQSGLTNQLLDIQQEQYNNLLKLEKQIAVESAKIQKAAAQDAANALSEKNKNEASANRELLNSRIESAKSEARRLENELSEKQTAAEGNFQELLQLQIDYGQKISRARAEEKKLQAQKDAIDTALRYDELIMANKDNAELVKQLEQQKASDLLLIQNNLSAELYSIELSRTLDYNKALQAREVAIRASITSTSRDIKENILKLLSDEIQAVTSQRDALLQNDKLTTQERLKIYQEYQVMLKTLQIKYAQERIALDLLDEQERYDTARRDAITQGILTNELDQNLRTQHEQNVNLIINKIKEQSNAALLALDKDLEKARLEVIKATTDALINASEEELKNRLADIETYTGAERIAAIESIKTWVIAKTGISNFTEALKALPEQVAKNVQSALDKIEAMGKKAAKTFIQAFAAVDLEGLQEKLDKILKPNTAQGVSQQAQAPYMSLIEETQQRISDLQTNFIKLSPEEQKAQQSNYDKMIADAIVFLNKLAELSGKAGAEAAALFTKNQKDEIAKSAITNSQSNFTLGLITQDQMQIALDNYAKYLNDQYDLLVSSGASQEEIEKARRASIEATRAASVFSADEQAKALAKIEAQTRQLEAIEKNRLDQSKQLFEYGMISAQEYQKSLDENVAFYQKRLDDLTKAGVTGPQLIAAQLSLEAAKRNALVAVTDAQTAAVNKLTAAEQQRLDLTRQEFEAGIITSEQYQASLKQNENYWQARIDALIAANVTGTELVIAQLSLESAKRAEVTFRTNQQAEALRKLQNDASAAETLFKFGKISEEEYRAALQKLIDYNLAIANSATATAEQRANALNIVADAENKLNNITNNGINAIRERIKSTSDLMLQVVQTLGTVAQALGDQNLDANVKGLANLISKVATLAQDIGRVAVNPADIGAWISIVTTVVGTIADAIGGFQKAYEKADKLKKEFNDGFSLVDGNKLQEVKVQSRGWLADLFAGGPEVIQEINKLATEFARTLESGTIGAIKNSVKAYLTVSDEELSKLNITAAEYAIRTLRTGIKEAIVTAVTDAIIQSAVIKGALGGLLTDLSLALASGDYAAAKGFINQIGAAIPGIIDKLGPLMEAFRNTIATAFPDSVDVNANVSVGSSNLPTIGFSDAIMLPDAQLLVILKPIADKFDMIASVIDRQVPAIEKLTQSIVDLSNNGFKHEFKIVVDENGATITEVESALRFGNQNI